jgi:hypothetical protein
MRDARHSSIVGGFDFVSAAFELAERLEKRMPPKPAEIVVPRCADRKPRAHEFSL